MRIWSVSPKYLDVKGLTAVWRETLLAKNVLSNNTTGYKNHPQLKRFKNSNDALNYINAYLNEILKESVKRGYNYNKDKVDEFDLDTQIPVNDKQVEYEFNHLQNRLKIRDTKKYLENLNITKIEVNNIFKTVSGNIEDWEKF